MSGRTGLRSQPRKLPGKPDWRGPNVRQGILGSCRTRARKLRLHGGGRSARAWTLRPPQPLYTTSADAQGRGGWVVDRFADRRSASARGGCTATSTLAAHTRLTSTWTPSWHVAPNPTWGRRAVDLALSR
eukprot:scaffold401_cov399-Prasinococcus_capsulatus_cf.AAC.13